MSTLCTYYNSIGNISNIIDTTVSYNTIHFFRKFSRDENELTICRLLKENPHENIVNIYDVYGNYIDMELLLYQHPTTQQLQSVISKALDHLHKLNIVYIDIKNDNIGYSSDTNTYKIFDFDMSGIVSEHDCTKWYLKPCEGFILKQIKETHKEINNNLYKIDHYAQDLYNNDFK